MSKTYYFKFCNYRFHESPIITVVDPHESYKLFAQTMEKLRKKGMAIWDRFTDGEISHDELIKKTKPIKNAIKRCLNQV